MISEAAPISRDDLLKTPKDITMKRILPLLIFMTACINASAKKEISNSAAVVSSLQSTSDTDIEVITIPVVVHVVYNTTQQNISDAQVISQINVLNKDYRGNNNDSKNIPSYFASLAGDGGFEFRLATVDPAGYSTSGIIRKQTSIQMFGVDDRIKSSARGGDDTWNRNKYLNIWVCNLAGGILGYTSTIGCAAEKDGVVIQFSAFGTVGSAAAPFNLGRTATHEIGHWLNLKHIWGDAYCGDDEINDTPKQRSSNRGRPTGEKFTCDMSGHGDMYMNFMDLTDDAGMFMFTQGQCKRMRALFNAGGQRHEILSSNALTGIAITKAVEATAPAVVAKSTSVFPNPAQSVITMIFSSSNNNAAQTITVYNNIGQPVMIQTITGSRITVNISQLKPGAYFIKTTGGAPEEITKFVKN